MSSTPPERTPLYDALICVVSCCLQSDSNIQKLARERKAALEVIDEYPLVLCEIISSNEEALSERHLASVFLKNYLQEIYLQTRENASLFNKGYGHKICLDLLDLLDIQHSNIKLMVAHNLSFLLAMEFWDFLSPRLIAMIKSNNPDMVGNAVFLLKLTIDFQFFESPNEPKVPPVWFDILLDVFKTTNYKSEIRANTICPMFVMIRYIKPYPTFLPECITKLSEEFEKALAEPYSPTSDFYLKCEILKCLYNCSEIFTDFCQILIPPSLPAIGNLLTNCCEQYKKIVRGIEKAPKDETENDEDPSNFYDLVTWILEFIFAMVDLMYFDVLLDDLDNLFYCLFVFMSCHSNMEKDLFIDLTDKDHKWMIRDLCYQILVYSIDKVEHRRRNGRALFFKSMHNVFQRLNSEIEESTSASDDMFKMQYMTRILESMMFGLGIVSEKLSYEDPDFVFPLEYYINTWTRVLQSQHSPTVTGRMLWLGGKFSLQLTPNTLAGHVKTILENLNSNDKYLFIPSAEALCNHLSNMGKMSAEKQYIFNTYAKDIITCLLTVTQDSSLFPLNHSLNALGYFIKANKELSKTHVDGIEDILIRTVLNRAAAPYIMREVSFIVAKLAQNQCFKPLIHDKFLTFVLNIIHHCVPVELKGDQDKALDLLYTYTLYSSTLDDLFVHQAFVAAAMLIGKDNNPDIDFIDEAAGALLTTLIVKVPNQLKYLRDEGKGQHILESFPGLIEMLLQPDTKVPGVVTGKLVVASIYSLLEVMEPHFEIILRNLVTSTCKSYKNIRAAYPIFLFICMLRTSSTINYLSILPGPNGGSALNYIMKKWLPEYIHQLEKIERKLMVLSIRQIIQNCLESEPDYMKMEEVMIPYDRPNEESPTGEYFNGIEYLYYQLVQFLLFEERLEKEDSGTPKDFSDYGEDRDARTEEDNEFLFHNHPFNINIVEHVVNFLKTGNEPYFTIIRKFFSSATYFKLRDLGCAIPELNIQEDME